MNIGNKIRIFSAMLLGMTVLSVQAADRVRPNAEVTKLPALTLGADTYMAIDGASDDVARPLQIVMNFKTKETVEEARPNGFLAWGCDFYLTFSGVKNGIFTANDCYLAGNYGTFGWVVIPTDGMDLENDVTYPVLAGYTGDTEADLGITYKQICEDVKDFTAAIYVAPAILEANPDFKVTLELKMTNPEDENDVITIGEPAVYTVADLKPNFSISVPRADDVKVNGAAPTYDEKKAIETIVKEFGANTGVAAVETGLAVADNTDEIAAAKAELAKLDVAEADANIAVPSVAVTLTEIKTEGDSVARMEFDVTPAVAVGEKSVKIAEFSSAVTFRLPVASTETRGAAKVYHNDELMGLYAVMGEGANKYIEVSSKTFSTFAVEPVAAAARIGDTVYTTLTAALAAVKNDAETVVLLNDIEENVTAAYLRGNIVPAAGKNITVTLTNTDWVYCPYTFVLNEGITLNIPYGGLFYYAGGTVIRGKVVTDAYYQRYAGTKLTIEAPGSLKVTSETFIVRYMDGDANAGIYIKGDNNDETVELDASVIYFYQGMINAKDATIKVATYWQTQGEDGAGSANLVLDNTKMDISVNDHQAKATGNSTVTLKNGSVMSVSGGYAGVPVAIDDKSAMVQNGVSALAATVGGFGYGTISAAVAAADDNTTIKVLKNVSVASSLEVAASKKNITLDLNGFTVSGSAGASLVNAGELTIKDSSANMSGTLAVPFVNNATAKITGGMFVAGVTNNSEIEVTGGAFASDVDRSWLADGYACGKVVSGGMTGYLVAKLPTATVTSIPNSELVEKNAPELTFALKFKADAVSQMQMFCFTNWYADFEFTVVGKDITFNLSDPNSAGYLAGQYDSWMKNWVSVPTTNVTLNANEPLRIMEYGAELMSKKGLKMTYGEVATIVKEFSCGVVFRDAFIAANSGLKVRLALKLYNPENESECYTIGSVYEFELHGEDHTFMMQDAYGNTVNCETVADVLANITADAEAANGGEVKVLKDVEIDGDLAVSGTRNLFFNLGANKLTLAEDKKFTVSNMNVAFVGSGSLVGFTAANVEIDDVSVLTLPASAEALALELETAGKYVTKNADETWSVANKFVLQIQMDGDVPAIGFLNDTRRTYVIEASSDLVDWSPVEYAETTGDSEIAVPLKWQAPASGRFFRVKTAE